MDRDVVIRAEGLGKKYLIGHQAERERYVALRDVIARNVRNFGRTAMDLVRGRPNVAGDELEEFWALKDVNFEIRRGDVVGVIGRNGAGKSTLLKVLSRITEPSEGRVEIRGRVASLLEVGTGFHPELTGRENIYLNGAILGMTHAEIRRKFDEIVDFAEVERFLDTPVKRYSSGMYVRLAFAVAAHLEPEILIVDEVLAVGDAEFQKKCLGKMGEVAGHGRTVLFVSHNMAAVHSLCSTSMLFKGGVLQSHGETSDIVASYESSNRPATAYKATVNPKLDTPHFTSLSTTFSGSIAHLATKIFSPIDTKLILNVHFSDVRGNKLGMASLGGFDPQQILSLKRGSQDVFLDVELPTLANGNYELKVNLEQPYGIFVDEVSSKLGFEVTNIPASTHGRALQCDWDAGLVQLNVSEYRVDREIEGGVQL